KGPGRPARPEAVGRARSAEEASYRSHSTKRHHEKKHGHDRAPVGASPTGPTRASVDHDRRDQEPAQGARLRRRRANNPARPDDPRGEVSADLSDGRPHESLELGEPPSGARHSAARDADRNHAAPGPRLPAAAPAEVDRQRARAVLREGEGSAEGHEARAVGTTSPDDPSRPGAQSTEGRAGRAGRRVSSVARGPPARGGLPEPQYWRDEAQADSSARARDEGGRAVPRCDAR